MVTWWQAFQKVGIDDFVELLKFIAQVLKRFTSIANFLSTQNKREIVGKNGWRVGCASTVIVSLDCSGDDAERRHGEDCELRGAKRG